MYLYKKDRRVKRNIIGGFMEKNKYISYRKIDHISKEEIKKACEEALFYHFEEIVVPPSYVSYARSILKEANIELTTIIGYPYGFEKNMVKEYAAITALEDGADEIELTISYPLLKEKNIQVLKEEIEQIRDAISGATLKLYVNVDNVSKEDIKLVIKICNETYLPFLVLEKGNWTFEEIEPLLKEKGELLSIQINEEVEEIEFIKQIEKGITRMGITRILPYLEEEKK